MINALLIGCGSVGLKHLEVLKSFTNKIDVVDIKDLSNVISSDSDVRHFYSINDIERENKYDLVVIATWANSHLKFLKDSIKFNPRGIIIEKPLSNCIKDCKEILKHAEKNKINVLCNFTRSISLIHFEILNFFNLNNDEILRIKWETNGNCIATNGIHWYNLAENIFNSEADNADGITYLVNENPRSSDLYLLQGNMTFTFKNKKKLFLSTEKKTVDNYIYFEGKNIKARLSGNSLEVYKNQSYKKLFNLSFNFHTELLKMYHEVLNPTKLEIFNIKSTENFLSLVIPLISDKESGNKLYDTNIQRIEEVEVPLS